MATEHQQLLADSAISDPSQDRLDRSPFANSLARSVLGLEGDDSFVIGLCGPWGSGKTSVLNLLLGQLEAVEQSKRPIIFRFNPWWFSGRSQLLESFLSQFGAALALPDRGENAGKISVLFQRLSIGLRPLSFLPFIGEAAKAGGEISKSIGDATRVYADAMKSDVFEARKLIDKSLEKFDRRIVIVMDDIDRLSADEIAELFLILKAVADFPKTVYLLAFDSRVVRRAIRQKLGVNGRTYLEKIVQLQVELPSVGYSAIHQIFLEQVSNLFATEVVSEETKQDFGNVFHDGVKYFLKTPRASKKLLNTLRFSYPALKGEICVPDLVGVATLFTFVPSAVQVIANNSEAFAGTEHYGDDRKKLRTFHDKWLEKLDASSRPHVEGIAKRLFPKFAWALDGPSYSSEFEAAWRRQLKVCSAAHFDKYFLFAVPTGVISEKEWAEIVDLIIDSERFEQKLIATTNEKSRLGYVSRCKELLGRLEDFAQTTKDTDRSEAVFKGVLKLGDKLIDVKDEEILGGLFPLNNETRVLRVLLRSLERFSSGIERVRLINEGIQNGFGLLTLTELVDTLGREHGKFGSKRRKNERREPLLTEEDFLKLMSVATQMIRTAANGEESSPLAQHPSSLQIVHHWCDFGSETTALRWLRRQAKRDKFLVELLSQASSKTRSHGMSDRVVQEHLTVNTALLGRFFNLTQLKRRCSKLLNDSPKWLTKEHTLLLTMTDTLISEAGKPLSERELRRRRLMDGDSESV